MSPLFDNVDLPDIFFDIPNEICHPPTTLLYNLTPRGIGTAQCESLKSYISRLADAHRIGTRMVLKHALYSELSPMNGYWRSDVRSMKGKSGYLSMGDITNNLVAVLAKTTGVAVLEDCTMLPIRRVFGTKGLLARNERYCPQCFLDQEHTEITFGHLIWEVACVNACPIHRIQLEPAICGAPQDKHLKLPYRKTLSGVCPTCGSIGYRCRKAAPVIASDIEIWNATQVAELISLFPVADHIFSRERTIAGLTSLVSQFTDGKSATAARLAGIHKSVLWGWQSGNYLPSLLLLLNLCLTAGVSIVSVMKGHAVQCSCPQFRAAIRKKRTLKPDIVERCDVLKEALVVKPPQSLGAVANSLGLGPRTLRYQFPELSSLVVARFRQSEMNKSAARHLNAKVLGQNLLQMLTDKGLPLTQRNFQAVSGEPLMPKSILFQVYKEARDKSDES